MSSNPHNQNLTNIYSKIAKKIVHSSSNKKIHTNKLNIKSNKYIVNKNKTLDNFLSLYNPNNNINNKKTNNKSQNKSKNTSTSGSSSKKNYSDSNFLLNKKRFKSKEEELFFKKEMEASKKIDKILENIRKEIKTKLGEEKNNDNFKKNGDTKKKKKINQNSFFLEALGLTEEEMKKKYEQDNKKESNDKEGGIQNILLKNQLNNIIANKISSIIIKDKLPKYFNYKVSHEDIYLNLLTFDFYNIKSKTEIIPNYFDNELHYRYIWIPNFLNELKYCLLNEKAEKSDIQNYKEIDTKIKLTFLSQEFQNISLLKITPTKNLNEFKKKILKDNDIIAIYSENEKMNFDDISISNTKKLNYFLGIVKREYDSYELKILIHSKDIEKYNLNNNDYNLKMKKEQIFNIKYLNNINSSLREFKALLYLELSNFKDILNPKKLLLKNNINIDNNNNNNINKNIDTKTNIFLNNIKSSDIYNSSQIEVLIKANQMKNNEVFLIQGPPGTGKTHTILGLISLFMLNKYIKLLICTQSNTAIDEICSRLLNKGLYDERLNKIDANFIRYGFFERRDKEKKYLDSNQGKILEKKSMDYLVDFKFKEKLENANIEKEKIIKEINILSIDKEKNKEQIKILENKKQVLLLNLNKNKFEKQNYEYFLLSNTPILCTTLNNSGNEKLKKNNINYDILIIDEACQCVEPSSLIPLCHGIKKLILVGDHQQLPATVFYPKAKNILYNRSLFERLIDNDIPRHILTIQYRMQTNIRQFISALFYDNKLLDSPDKNYVSKINNNTIYKIIDIKKNFFFFDLNFSEEKFDENIKSFYNMEEILFTFYLIKSINNIIKKYNSLNNNYKYKYAVITPYQGQVKKIKEEKNKYNELINIDIVVNTVDSFQGQERDIVLLSTVRANNKNNNIGEGESIGFLNDYRRMNVALSRAKFGCFIIGNSQKFQKDSYWAKLITFCKDKKCYYNINSINEFKKGMENIFLK